MPSGHRANYVSPDPPPGITLRRAVATDAPAIGAVFDAATRAGWTYLDSRLTATPMFSAHDWEQLVADHAPPNLLLVAVDETGIVGYTAVHSEYCEMFLLFVHPSHGRRGIGRTLLTAADDALHAAGCHQAFLYVHEQNERAIAGDRAAGYRPDGSVRASDFSGTQLREVRLLKRL